MCLALSSDFNQILSFVTHSCGILLYQISRKFVQWEAVLNMRPDGHMDRLDEAYRLFLVFALTHLKIRLGF